MKYPEIIDNTFPINNFNKNKQKYNVKEIGYIVLDLKNAISNGTKIKDINNPQIQSKYLKLRNIKLVKNNGLHPQIKISFWCALSTKWDEDQNEIPNQENNKIDQSTQSLNLQQHQQQKQEPEREVIIIKDINNMTNNKSNDYSIGNRWYCVIHKIQLFTNVSNVRCLIVSMNERYILHLPLDEINVNNNEFSNDYPNFSWYLQSKADNDKNTEWNTIASYSTNIHQFISNNHSKQFILKLYGAQNKCIANATISVSWEPFLNKENINNDMSEYSSFSQDIDNLLNEQQTKNKQQEKEQKKEEEVMSVTEKKEEKDEYMVFNDENIMDIDNIDIAMDANNNSYKYRIGVDIRSIRDLTNSYNIQCKYRYNLFDNNRLFQSNPPILVNKCEEKPINDGFCAYEIVLKSNELYTNLYKYPLILQLIHKDIYKKDIEIGYSFINLSQLLKVNKSASNLRYIDKYYTIYSIKCDDNNLFNKTHKEILLNKIKCKPIGNIRVCCSLEDFKIKQQEQIQAESIIIDNNNNNNNNDNERIETVQDDIKNKEEEIMNINTMKNQIIDNDKLTENFVQNAKYLQNEIVEELKKWKIEQQQKWQKKWKQQEIERLNALELEWRKNEDLRSEQLNRKKLEIIKLEKKLKTSLYDIECQEKKLKLEQLRIEERRRELEQNYKLKTNEIVGSIKRLRNDNKMEIETLNRTISFLKNENDLISTKYRNEEKRCNDFRNELNKNKKHYDSSSIGQLQIENNKLNNKIIELNEKLNEKINEIKELNKIINDNNIKIKRLQNEIVENEKKQIDKEKKAMEKLKLELMTKSHFKQLRNDRNELQQIKNTLKDLMNQS